ncbi:MAG: cyclic-phosphate processing receiver domain-containing protein [Campylobacterota bacterium]|nr:cyclic-phosphate processing receiver domain-containing protein [Campylobacterota bacterium]
MRLYLDDIREPKDDSFIIVRNYDEAIEFIKQNGIPPYISFDHDLGCDKNGDVLKSGYDFAKWLVDMDIDGIHSFPDDFKFNVHSANPIGRNNIEAILHNYLDFKISQELG